jgi:tetraacyldisaccharide 4'-kinase
VSGPGAGLGRALHRGVRRFWSGEGGGVLHRVAAAVTAPLAALFGVGVRLRNRAYDTGLLPARSGVVPVVSVGNLSVGGTGKTPVTAWIVGRLRARGVRPGIVSRGYGADELALHRRWNPDLPVVADPDRVQGVATAAGAGAEVAVVDDGFQHRRLARDADVVLMGATDPFPPRLLPRGPYREPLAALQRASVVLVTARGDGEAAAGEALVGALRRLPRHPPVGLLHLVPGEWSRLDGRVASPPHPSESLLLVASVARPGGVERLVREGIGEGVEIELVAYPDHHPYTSGDLASLARRAGPRRVVTTEKDAVKLQSLSGHLAPGAPEPLVLSLEVRPADGVEGIVDRLLDRVLGRRAGGGRPGDGAPEDPASGREPGP